LEIKRGHMIPLGYGKHWRSDDIVGLRPIENGRGPGRRTEVFVASVAEPIIASRGHDSILDDMGYPAPDERQAAELREAAADLLNVLSGISAAQRLILGSEARFDVARWEERLARILSGRREGETHDAQGDLFG